MSEGQAGWSPTVDQRCVHLLSTHKLQRDSISSARAVHVTMQHWTQGCHGKRTLSLDSRKEKRPENLPQAGLPFQ